MGALVSHPGAAARYARRTRRPLTAWTVADITPRARTAGVGVPGAAARDRLSRPCAGRLLLGRARRPHRLSQRDARRMARHRPHRVSRPGSLTLARHRPRRRASRCSAAERPRSAQPRPDHRPRPRSSRTARACRCASSTACRWPPTARRARRARSSSTAAPARKSPEALRAAEVRFTRFFNNTPIAIAAVDRSGRIGRTNAPFLRLFGTATAGRHGPAALDRSRRRGGPAEARGGP